MKRRLLIIAVYSHALDMHSLYCGRPSVSSPLETPQHRFHRVSNVRVFVINKCFESINVLDEHFRFKKLPEVMDCEPPEPVILIVERFDHDQRGEVRSRRPADRGV